MPTGTSARSWSASPEAGSLRRGCGAGTDTGWQRLDPADADSAGRPGAEGRAGPPSSGRHWWVGATQSLLPPLGPGKSHTCPLQVRRACLWVRFLGCGGASVVACDWGQGCWEAMDSTPGVPAGRWGPCGCHGNHGRPLECSKMARPDGMCSPHSCTMVGVLVKREVLIGVLRGQYGRS